MAGHGGSRSLMSDSLQLHGLYSPWNSPGQNTEAGGLSLLQGIFPTRGLNPGLLHCGQILYQLSHKGSPRILERVAYPFSSRSSQPRNWAGVSCMAGIFFTNWSMREAHMWWGMCPVQCISQNIHWNVVHMQCCTHQLSSVQSLSRIWLFATPWIAARQAGGYLWPLACIYLGHLCLSQPKAKLSPSLCLFLS